MLIFKSSRRSRVDPPIGVAETSSTRLLTVLPITHWAFAVTSFCTSGSTLRKTSCIVCLKLLYSIVSSPFLLHGRNNNVDPLQEFPIQVSHAQDEKNVTRQTMIERLTD